MRGMRDGGGTECGADRIIVASSFDRGRTDGRDEGAATARVLVRAGGTVGDFAGMNCVISSSLSDFWKTRGRSVGGL